MATVTVLERDMVPTQLRVPLINLLNKVNRAEKKIFPKDEALDFEVELKKRNTGLVILLGTMDSRSYEDCPIAAYLLYARFHGIALVHKVCVLEVYRRQGCARNLLLFLQDRLRSQGCKRLQLWVDEGRHPARTLYDSLGFRVIDLVDNYYGVGRNGIKMVYELTSIP
ncbi:hypothetical protein MMC13_003971 [Lambiella insularis]|nr:hypothetical protein [Lambiella insularis]